MKKLFLILFCFILVTGLAAQSLLQNPEYKKSLEYKKMSETAMENGDYDKAIEYANLSAEHARKSDDYVNMMVARYRANQGLTLLRNRLSQVKRAGGDKSHPAEYGAATAGYETAQGLFTSAEYPASREASAKALELLAGIVPPSKSLPAAYKVRLIPANRDCLWKISAYDFVYGDPALWKRLYEANKNKMPEPENPDLIHPGMILAIPSIKGETRSGTWDNGVIK